MKTTPQTLLRIQQMLPTLSGNYRVIAERILAHPDAVIREKVSEFAQNCNCDPAQAIRFCQKLNYDGFSSLKNKIAQELIDPKRTLHKQIIEPATPFDRLKETLQQNFIRTINDTLSILTEKSILQAAELISGARQILVCGFGSSSLVARDLQCKLFRIGFHAMFLDDAENCRTSCASLSKEDLLIAISFSGENNYLLENTKIAGANHTPILALTNYPQSALAQSSDCTLLTASDEQRLRLGAMDSIIAQYVVNDLLSIVLATRNPADTEKRILNIFEKTDNVQKNARI